MTEPGQDETDACEPDPADVTYGEPDTGELERTGTSRQDQAPDAGALERTGTSRQDQAPDWSEFESASVVRCPNCDTELHGNWCHLCGEKHLDREARGLRPLLGESFTAVTDLDGRLWRTLRALVLRPGFLSREYLAGRRRLWIGPASLFLLVNLVYFLAPPLSDFNLTLGDQIEYQPWGGWASNLVESRIAERGVSLESYAAQYAAESSHVAKSLILWHIPWIAAVLALAVPRRFYFAEHLVVATHGFTFFLALALIFQWVIRPIIGVLMRWTDSAALAPVILQSMLGLLFLAVFLYWSVSCGRVYGIGPFRSVLTGGVFAVGLAVGHLSYRWVQFIVTFALS